MLGFRASSLNLNSWLLNRRRLGGQLSRKRIV